MDNEAQRSLGAPCPPDSVPRHRQCWEPLSGLPLSPSKTAPRVGEGALVGPYPVLPSANSAICFCLRIHQKQKGKKKSRGRVLPTTKSVDPPSCRRIGRPTPVSARAPAHCGGSGPRRACLAHEGGAALLKVQWSLTGVNHNCLLIHDLTGGVGEGRQGQGDSLQLPLTRFLVMLLFQVLPPGKKRGTCSSCASCVALLTSRASEVLSGQGRAGCHHREPVADVRGSCSARLPQQGAPTPLVSPPL